MDVCLCMCIVCVDVQGRGDAGYVLLHHAVCQCAGQQCAGQQHRHPPAVVNLIMGYADLHFLDQ